MQSIRGKTIFAFFVAGLYIATGGVFYLAATRDYHEVAGLDGIRLTMLILLMPLLAKYIFQLACSPFYWIKCRLLQKRMEGQTPSVSVLIPAWNEEVGIVKTIASVLNTEYARLQIVVINDGSTDGTHERVTRFIADYDRTEHAGTEIKYLNLSNGGKARAMNRALAHAEGEIVITIDADSVMAPDAIVNLVKQFDDPAVGGVAGNVIVGNRKKPIEWMQQMEYLYGFFFKRADALFNAVYIIGGAAAAYRRNVLLEMGGFDHSIITEDIEMSTRILSRGYKTRYACDAVVYTEGPSDLQGLCSQRLRWKYGRIMTFIKHRRLFFSLRRPHNPYLTFVVLPIAVYAELLLLTEVAMLATFFAYTVITSDYMPLACVITLLSAIVGIQIITDPKARFHRNLLWIAPAAWLLFYAVDMVEFQALIRSLKRLATGKDLKWQKWVRVGVLDNACLGSRNRLPALD
jgi:cellulose synthase/poly-beta-1,6-N-acetylglucosamine synthase-like glycosyltransferase